MKITFLNGTLAVRAETGYIRLTVKPPVPED